MKIVHDFRYERPKNLKDALALLGEYGERARPLAGGTDVVVNMKPRSILQLVKGAGTSGASFPSAARVRPIDTPEILISLRELNELREISIKGDKVVVGPLATMTQIESTPGLPPAVECLKEAAAVMGTPLIRNLGTIGGNLVNARPAADTAIAVIALGAEIELSSGAGVRKVEASRFITAPGRTAKRPDELVTAIRISTAPHQGSAYIRQGTRKQLEIALASAATWVELDPRSGKVANARICLGAVGPTPLLAERAVKDLVGREPTAEVVASVAKAARNDAKPIDDFRGSAAYRLQIIEAFVGRTVAAAVTRAKVKGK